MTRCAAIAAAGLALALSPRSAHAQEAQPPLSTAEADALRAEVATLKARLEALEQRLAATAPASPAPPRAAAAAPRIEWKGSPRIAQDDRAFKVKGRIQADASYVSAPQGLADRGLGFSTEFRRIRLGGEGELGNGFGYKLELELSDNEVELVDTFVTYRSGPWLLTLGNHNQFQSLDELVGDTSGSVMERAAFTDAFGFERRLGLSAQYGRGPLLAQFGVFSDDVDALANSSDGPAGGDENNSYSLDGRLVFAPRLGATQLHLGASGHWRRLGRTSAAPLRYRQRPFVHSTNTRLIGTPALAVREETSRGVEFAAVRGRWHAAAEAHWLHAERIGAPPGRFRGAYAEIGAFLTPGDTRPYGSGIFTAPKPKAPLGDGGIGAVQLNVRYDFLDLNSGSIRGGTQDGYIAALVWTPVQYLRFNLNYAYLDYSGATALADGRTDYGVHAVGSRFELDF